ncbi:conserved hypothetical ATP-binding domain-containing protein, putative [Eimeria necatrix]|uniref:GPN-loop GTPase 2 n=1 Tax=Eimeria necatrix TaxID=51315 RepID=U6MR30_9EIME|nr:conserved hypothetical ATP-binding domain-containing protein, putative [Eimeria necatrix]CDJ66486.1 conserved hypothetical ATP-binding domain-containing protein, putative [Eimeria necatrix]
MALNAQLQLELPHVNVLSKVDLLRLHRKDLRAFTAAGVARIAAAAAAAATGGQGSNLSLYVFDAEFRLEFYADAYELQPLLEAVQEDPHPLGRKLMDFSRAVCELVEDFNLVSFYPVCVTDKECMLLVLRVADAANGFALGNYAENERGYPLQLDTEEERQMLIERLQERYVDFDPAEGEGDAEASSEVD